VFCWAPHFTWNLSEDLSPCQDHETESMLA